MLSISIGTWISIIGGLITAEMAIGHGTIQLTDAIPEKWIPAVKAWCNILAALGGIVVGILGQFTHGSA